MIALLLLVGSTLQAPEAPPRHATAPAEAAAEESDASAAPKKAARKLIVAMIEHDEAALREVVLDDKDLDWLLKGPRPPADRLDEIKEQVGKMPLKALKAGDEIEIPKAGKVVIEPEEVSDDRAVIQMAGNPIPLRLKKVDDEWRVDAAPIIAARKAAAAARKAAEAAGAKAD